MQNQNSSIKNLKCKQHNQQEITFFCTVNQWHFKPLCSQCIPQHTQNHPKNIKIILEGKQKVLKQAFEQKQKGQKMYKQSFQKIVKLLMKGQKIQDFALEYKIIQKIQEQIINQIKNQFQSIKQTIKKQRFQIQKYQKQLLQKLKQNIQFKLKSFEKIVSDEQITQEWIDSVKYIYFKGDLQIYKAEIDQIIQEYENAILYNNPKYYEKINQFLLKQLKNLFSEYLKQINLNKQKKKSFYPINQIEDEEKANFQTKKEEENLKKNKNIIKSTMSKDYENSIKLKMNKKPVYFAPKPKITKKRCQYCDQQMQYLTQLKKHLVCKYCGGKERNYTNKIKNK